MTNEAAEKRRAYYKAWRAANPEKVKANNARYWERKAERQERRCAPAKKTGQDEILQSK